MAGLCPVLRQRIQLLPLFSRQPFGQSTLDFASCSVAHLDAKPFERAPRREDNATAPAFLHRQFRQIGQPVILNCMRQQPTRQLCGGPRAERAKTKPILKLYSVTPTSLFRCEIVVEDFGMNIDLIRNKRDNSCRWPLLGVQGAARMTQVAKHERVAEAAVITTATPDHRDIRIGQCVMAHQFTLLRKRIEQCADLRFGQLRPSCHSCLLAV